jgi:hypothetical protein
LSCTEACHNKNLFVGIKNKEALFIKFTGSNNENDLRYATHLLPYIETRRWVRCIYDLRYIFTKQRAAAYNISRLIIEKAKKLKQINEETNIVMQNKKIEQYSHIMQYLPKQNITPVNSELEVKFLENIKEEKLKKREHMLIIK